jgi:hypothetical protein
MSPAEPPELLAVLVRELAPLPLDPVPLDPVPLDRGPPDPVPLVPVPAGVPVDEPGLEPPDPPLPDGCRQPHLADRSGCRKRSRSSWRERRPTSNRKSDDGS